MQLALMGYLTKLTVCFMVLIGRGRVIIGAKLRYYQCIVTVVGSSL